MGFGRPADAHRAGARGRKDAGARAGDAPGVVGRTWMLVVRIGSAVAAEIARRV